MENLEIKISLVGRSNRIEDGNLVTATKVQLFEYDYDGRYINHSYGYFNVIPEFFDQKINNGFDGKTYYTYKINEKGFQWIENELGIKHPGRGYVGIKFLTDDDICKIREKKMEMFKKLQSEIDNLNSLI